MSTWTNLFISIPGCMRSPDMPRDCTRKTVVREFSLLGSVLTDLDMFWAAWRVCRRSYWAGCTCTKRSLSQGTPTYRFKSSNFGSHAPGLPLTPREHSMPFTLGSTGPQSPCHPFQGGPPMVAEGFEVRCRRQRCVGLRRGERVRAEGVRHGRHAGRASCREVSRLGKGPPGTRDRTDGQPRAQKSWTQPLRAGQGLLEPSVPRSEPHPVTGIGHWRGLSVTCMIVTLARLAFSAVAVVSSAALLRCVTLFAPFGGKQGPS